jgi:predicted metalloprotease with PDZ domain
VTYRQLACLLFLVICVTAAEPQQAAPSGPIDLYVDVTNAPQKILHAELTIPTSPGQKTFVYPKWIPGEHAPSGPIRDLAGLSFRGGGKLLPWSRDDLDLYAFHVEVPQGATQLNINLDFLATEPPGPFISGPCTGATFAVINWNELLLYPKDVSTKAIRVVPHLRLPTRWKYATALQGASVLRTSSITFDPVTLDKLVDSPVIAGEHLREVEIAPGHYIDLVSDNPKVISLSSNQIAAYGRVVNQARLLFGTSHYSSYHFLVALSDELGGSGLEHRESSDDRLPENTFVNVEAARRTAWLLPHEFVHSWNGKFRRPIGLITPDFQTPMKGDLLWVYEGLTTYLGDVLATRAGLWSPDDFREQLAVKAAVSQLQHGREWRDLEDTAISAQFLLGTMEPYSTWRRGTDYYPEGELLWMDIDTLLRIHSGGRESLDTFCKRFFGIVGSAQSDEVPYDFEDLVRTLGSLDSFDWRTYITQRLHDHSADHMFDGLLRAGYGLAFNEHPRTMKRLPYAQGELDARFSIGGIFSASGHVEDVVFRSPLFDAAIVPKSTVTAVNGRPFTLKRLASAISATFGTSKPLVLTISYGGQTKTVTIPYRAGSRLPTLERTENEDLLSSILAPLR